MKTLQAFMLLTLLLAATHLPAGAGKVALSLATKLAIVQSHIAQSNKEPRLKYEASIMEERMERIMEERMERQWRRTVPNAETNNKERINREHQHLLRRMRLATEYPE